MAKEIKEEIHEILTDEDISKGMEAFDLLLSQNFDNIPVFENDRDLARIVKDATIEETSNQGFKITWKTPEGTTTLTIESDGFDDYVNLGFNTSFFKKDPYLEKSLAGSIKGITGFEVEKETLVLDSANIVLRVDSKGYITLF
ncbi:MAG TPA: hypothetical protein VF185_00145 [Patescibacteria group bacterium]